jgi:spore coat polysaccharide biosynthesis protein SpsF
MERLLINDQILAIVQARMSSSRLPGKVLERIGNQTVLEILLKRLQKSKYIDKIIVATTALHQDDIIIRALEKHDIEYFRGSENNVLERYYQAAIQYQGSIVIRITADNPLTDVQLMDQQIKILRDQHYDYVTTKNVILGLGSEVFNKETLIRVYYEVSDSYNQEHVTTYIRENDEKFNIKYLDPPALFNNDNIRLTIDEPADLALFREIEKYLGDLSEVGNREVIRFLIKHPDIINVNKDVRQKG